MVLLCFLCGSESFDSLDFNNRPSDSLDKTLKDLARTYFHKIIRFVSQHVLDGLGPSYRRCELCEQICLDEFRIFYREA